MLEHVNKFHITKDIKHENYATGKQTKIEGSEKETHVNGQYPNKDRRGNHNSVNLTLNEGVVDKFGRVAIPKETATTLQVTKLNDSITKDNNDHEMKEKHKLSVNNAKEKILTDIGENKDAITYFSMKDPVSKELRCHACSFESFSKKKMLTHVNKFHATEEIKHENDATWKQTKMEGPEKEMQVNDHHSNRDRQGSDNNVGTLLNERFAVEVGKVSIPLDLNDSLNKNEKSFKFTGESLTINVNTDIEIVRKNDSTLDDANKPLNNTYQQNLNEFMDIAHSSSFDESNDSVDYHSALNESNRKRVHFDEEEAFSPLPKRRLVSPKYRELDSSEDSS